MTPRAAYRNFAKGGANLGYGQKRGGAPGGSSVVSCEVLHSRGGARMTQGGANAPPPPAPPKYGPDPYVLSLAIHSVRLNFT